jgi:hypothetical protein
MKFYLLAGGLLITAASVFGIADYMKTKNKKEFKALYKETPVTLKEDVKLQDIHEEDFSRSKLETVTPPKEEQKQAVATKHKKSVQYAGDKPEIEMIPMYEEIKTPENIPEITTPEKPEAKKKLKKKINMKMYSRAPLREEPLPVDSAAAKKEK